MKYMLMALTIIVLFAFAPAVLAQGGGERYPEGVDPTDVYRISRGLYCDVCAGVPLADCPSDQCQAWREEIADLLAAGQTESEIRQHFADRYGDKVSGVPLDDTNRFFVYAVPIALAIVALGGIGWQVRRWQVGGNRRALQAARQAGNISTYDRPVPDNVDPQILATVMADLEAIQK